MSPPRTSSGPGRAFDEFVTEHQAPLHRYALALTGNPHDADDLLQGALVKVWLAWPRLGPTGSMRTYARTIIARDFVSAWRRWGRRVSPTDSVPELPARTEPDLADRDLVWRGLAQLGRRQRTVIVLRYYEDLDLATIADMLGISVGTVKSQLSRGLAHLRDALEEGTS